ncbi:WXG100 family type VII secretion target [Nocardia brasiliensis]|uniref:WXG100 family type VII secretion target n=1 Tax=Nocardia brasiliensis TaxID=37326 RepID=UPI00366D72F6
MTDMLYDKATMLGLYESLKTYHGTLMQQVDVDFPAATNKLQTAWENNASFAAFLDVKKKWDTEFSDTNELLQRIATEVDNSLQRAFQTDQTIGDGFGA